MQVIKGVIAKMKKILFLFILILGVSLNCFSEELIIPKGTKKIEADAYVYNRRITSVVIPEGVTSIGGGAFGGCENLQKVTIPNTVKTIGENAFGGCISLKAITLPNSVTTIEDWAFSECSLKSIVIPNGIKGIGKYLFSDCHNLKNITIPDSVTSIGEGAFQCCSALESITIPASVKTIGENVFEGCDSLRTIKVPEKNKESLKKFVNQYKSKIQFTYSDSKKISEFVIKSSDSNQTVDLVGTWKAKYDSYNFEMIFDKNGKMIYGCNNTKAPKILDFDNDLDGLGQKYNCWWEQGSYKTTGNILIFSTEKISNYSNSKILKGTYNFVVNILSNDELIIQTSGTGSVRTYKRIN